jgi:hypothetical protein
MMKIFLRLFAFSLLAVSFFSRAGDAISEAEQRVFLDDHLKNIKQSSVLTYRLHQVGKPEETYDDSAKVSIKAATSKTSKQVDVDYLSGTNKVALPDISDAQGNPVILYFLEKDVRDMHRIVGGQEAYFRKRIRLALADTAEVHPVTVTYNGHAFAGSEVRIFPYANDPLRQRFGDYYKKSYVFTISDQVPGGVYQIRTQVDNPKIIAPDAPPLMQTTLTLSSVGK